MVAQLNAVLFLKGIALYNYGQDWQQVRWKYETPVISGGYAMTGVQIPGTRWRCNIISVISYERGGRYRRELLRPESGLIWVGGHCFG